MDELKLLYKIEEKVEQCYINLAQLEILGEIDSPEYNEYIKLIIELTNDEKRLFARLDRSTLSKIIKQVNRDNFNKNNSNFLGLGFLNNAYYNRLQNMLNLQLGDDLFDYANVVRYDINQIMLSFLDTIINNDYYIDIRKELIFYKYNLLFLNVYSEHDFLINRNINTISLETDNCRTEDLASYIFVDKTVLVLESIDYLCYITNAKEDFRYNTNTYVNMVITIINILARFSLCEKDTLALVYDDFSYLLEDDSVYEDIKELIREMLEMLETIKNKIEWAR